MESVKQLDFVFIGFLLYTILFRFVGECQFAFAKPFRMSVFGCSGLICHLFTLLWSGHFSLVCRLCLSLESSVFCVYLIHGAVQLSDYV